MTAQRKLLVTSALPYANGPLHLGHLLEHIQTDIWVRAQKMLGQNCIAVCGDDAHGTPIMLKAEQLGISPLELTAAIQQSHIDDFTAFGIEYDQYHSTHSEENQALAEAIYLALEARGDIIKKSIRQAYDPLKMMFLPDRYVKGQCPVCKAEDQYGDSCERCAATYSPTDLINPVSVVSGAKPIEKESEHYFFNLPVYEDFLKNWTRQGHLQTEVANKLEEWFQSGLKPWDISRDAPYFGFLIPGTADKYFYVWLDAPIGYMAAFKAYCAKTNTSFEEFWSADSKAELYHFIGKDIVYFHALFWPALLHGSGQRLPSSIFAHGFLTINGLKMSKSRGSFIEARQYLAQLNPEYLRYYFAAKLNGRIEDVDLNFEDFSNRINADLVGKIVNIASRSAGFIHKLFEGHLATELDNPALQTEILALAKPVSEAFIARDYALAVRQIMEGADKVNQYIDQQKPWVLAKDPQALASVQLVCTQALNLFRLLMAYLKPILPSMAARAEIFLNCPALNWQDLTTPLLAQTINPFEPLMQRVDKERVAALFTETSS